MEPGDDCNRLRELISARVDGETTDIEEQLIDRHTANCQHCEAYEQQTWALRRTLRVTEATAPAPAPIVVRAAPSTLLDSALRALLFAIGGTLVIFHGAQLFANADESSLAHLGRHSGVFGIALGIGMLAVSWKPHRAIGLVPLTGSVAFLMAAVAAFDLFAGRVSMLSEAAHVLEFAGLICLWVISGGPTRARRRIASLANREPLPSNLAAWPTA